VRAHTGDGCGQRRWLQSKPHSTGPSTMPFLKVAPGVTQEEAVDVVGVTREGPAPQQAPVRRMHHL
jgi:hypothetical protein